MQFAYNQIILMAQMMGSDGLGLADGHPSKHIVPVRTTPKIGRNAICPCGSGAKYKKCCMGGA
jgi:preprotein translocase subunit SecA